MVVLEAMNGGAEDRDRLEDDVDWHPRQEWAEPPFVVKRGHKDLALSAGQRQDALHDPAPDVDAARRQHGQRQVAGFGAKDGDEHIQRRTGKWIRSGWI